MAAALGQHGVEVDVAESALEAKRLLDRFGKEYCCVLLDLILPDGDGNQIAHHIRENENDVPVLVVTGSPLATARLTVSEYADVVRLIVRKPVDMETLTTSIFALAGRTR